MVFSQFNIFKLDCIKKHIKIIVVVTLSCYHILGLSQTYPDSLIGVLKQPKAAIIDKSKIDSTYLRKGSKDTQEKLLNKGLIKRSGISTDSTISIQNKADSLKIRAVKTIKVKRSDLGLHGSISNQFDYGTVPYYLINSSSPTSAFKSQGDVRFSIKNVPLIFNYFYANPGGLFGMQNYYTLRFDKEAYDQKLRNECLEKKTVYQNKLKETQKLKQDYGQKLAFCESMQGYTATPRPGTPGLQGDQPLLETKERDSYTNIPDTSGLIKYRKISAQDSLKNKENLYLDSLSANFNADTNYQKIKDYKEKIEVYEKQIKEYQQAINFLDSNQSKGEGNPYLNKTKNFLGNIKNFEIGLCYPNYSTFLINNLTLKGINVGYEAKNYFVNATYGKTVNNLLTPQTNNSVINSFQNYSNFFDLKKNEDSRKIIAGKIGVGNVAQSYLAFGALYGVGNQSYYTTTSTQEKNIVYEVDSKLTYKGYVLSASFAKSFLNRENSNNEQNVLSQERNNAFQLKLSGAIPYIKTKFSLGYRLIDPFFKSYGIGFLRTDNKRYEAKLEQIISSKFKVGINYRHDEDNILKRFGYKSNLDFISMNVKGKFFKKRLDIQLIYTPILQKIENLTTHFISKNKSDMKNVVATYTPKFKKVITTLTGLYSQYTLYDSISLRNMENVSVGALVIFKNSLKLSLNSSYFNSNVRDSVNSPKAVINSFETAYTFHKNIIASLILKHSYNFSGHNNYYGFAGNVNLPLFKAFTVDLHFEKLIIGDFYNSLNSENINNFPYYSYIKLNLKF